MPRIRTVFVKPQRLCWLVAMLGAGTACAKPRPSDTPFAEASRSPSSGPAAATPNPSPNAPESCEGMTVRRCVEVGDEYWNGRGRPQDTIRARALFHSACESGDLVGCFREALSLHLEEPRDLARAERLFTEQCDKGHNGACTNLAGIFEDRGDMPAAVQLYQRACDAGANASCANLAHMHRKGRGVPRNPAKAFELNDKACKQGDPRSCNNLGDMYETGDGVTKDLAMAERLYEGVCTAAPAASPYRLEIADTRRRHAFGCYSLAMLLRRQGSADATRIGDLMNHACQSGVEQACKQTP